MKHFILHIFIMILGTGYLFSASDLKSTGNGARAAAMGNAFTGVADDATAMSWNAAGLTQLYNMEASIVGRLGFGSVKLGGVPSIKSVEDASAFQLNFLSIVFPFSVGEYNIVGGVALRNIYDFQNERTFKYASGDDETFISEGGVNAITPAFAVQINDILSIGAAINLFYGEAVDKYKNSFGADEKDAKAEFEGSSFDIGLLIRPSQKFSLGANFNLPHELREETAGFKDTTKVPFFFSIGAAYRATDNLLLAFDYQHRPWSNSENFEDVSRDVDLNSLHFGLEYIITNGNAVIPIRFGFHTSPLFVWDEDDKQIVTGVLALGTGLVMGSFILDAAFEFEKYKQDFRDGSSLEQTDMRITIGSSIHFGGND